MSIILHPRTRQQIENYVKQPSHGLLLTGRPGSGKLFTAKWIANQLNSEVFIVRSEEGKSSITIDQIRELYQLTRTGTPLVIIIKDAQELGREAQNAFLKLLEEPPRNTYFILTAKSKGVLLETIQSRSQHIEVLPPMQKDLLGVTHKLPEANIASLLYTSEGLVGIFTSLLSDETRYNEHQDSMQSAKKFFTSSIYDRHLMCIEHKYEKQWIQELLSLLSILVRALLKTTTDKTQLDKLTKQAQLLEETANNIFNINGNPKIHLARLCQKLG
jgi:DNA polymerase-3 subunit delta'